MGLAPSVGGVSDRGSFASIGASAAGAAFPGTAIGLCTGMEVAVDAAGWHAQAKPQTTDREALRRSWGGDLGSLGSWASGVCADVPIFLKASDRAAIEQVVRAVECVSELPNLLPPLPADFPRSRSRGAFMGFDFHISTGAPQLIEVNTNAGGALIAARLTRAQRAPDAGWAFPHRAYEFEFVAMLEREMWLETARELRSVAIVDDAPSAQFLYPEFLAFAELLRERGVRAVVVDPGDLRLEGGALFAGMERVDLVYNRVTDFSLSDPTHRVLREAWVSGAAVVTPNPRHHAVQADKGRLVLWSDPDQLRDGGAPDWAVDVLSSSVPATLFVTPDQVDRLWKERGSWFFKPRDGFGSRAAYRGDKITRGRFEEVCGGSYIAQRCVPPPTRMVQVGAEDLALKYDVRAFAYAGEVQLYIARLYQGQTTNLRTVGGGFAAVALESESGDCPALV
jgi:hypothetical protein